MSITLCLMFHGKPNPKQIGTQNPARHLRCRFLKKLLTAKFQLGCLTGFKLHFS